MRLRLRAVPLALALLMVTPSLASAGSVWDPDDPAYALDIRWTGVYVQADGRLRVTMSFHAPVRLRWFNRGNDWTRVFVGFTNLPIPPYYHFAFFRNRAGKLRAQLCESGSICTAIVPVSRPNRFTIRAKVKSSFGPGVGWRFRGITREAEAEPPKRLPLVIDGTTWSVVS